MLQLALLDLMDFNGLLLWHNRHYPRMKESCGQQKQEYFGSGQNTVTVDFRTFELDAK